MKHLNPPDNLPVVPDESETTEEVSFRDPGPGDIVDAVPAPEAARASGVPEPRSLQPIRLSMAKHKQRPIRAPNDLLSVDDVAERLLISRAAIYRLVSCRRIAFYRLPGGLRFKVMDVDTYLEGRRLERVEPQKYGRTQNQG